MAIKPVNYKLKRIAPGNYDVLVNNGPKTRYFSLGHIAGGGTKWEYGGETYKSKTLAKEAAIIAHEVQRIAIEEDEARGDCVEVFVDAWPEDAIFQKGDLLKHELVFSGPCESVHRHRGVLRYGIRVPAGVVAGRAEQFTLVEEEK